MKQEINLFSEVEEVLSEDEGVSAKSIIEAFLFSTNEPLSLARLKFLLKETHDLTPSAIRSHIAQLQHEYDETGRSFRIEELPQGFILRARPLFHPFLEALAPNRRANKLSQAALEVLAIVAYRQPITRAGVEAIRGIDSSGIISQLLDRELITPAGRLDAPGKPTLYRTSTKFLTHFGIRSMEELRIDLDQKKGYNGSQPLEKEEQNEDDSTDS